MPTYQHASIIPQYQIITPYTESNTDTDTLNGKLPPRPTHPIAYHPAGAPSSAAQEMDQADDAPGVGAPSDGPVNSGNTKKQNFKDERSDHGSPEFPGSDLFVEQDDTSTATPARTVSPRPEGVTAFLGASITTFSEELCKPEHEQADLPPASPQPTGGPISHKVGPYDTAAEKKSSSLSIDRPSFAVARRIEDTIVDFILATVKWLDSTYGELHDDEILVFSKKLKAVVAPQKFSQHARSVGLISDPGAGKSILLNKLLNLHGAAISKSSRMSTTEVRHEYIHAESQLSVPVVALVHPFADSSIGIKIRDRVAKVLEFKDYKQRVPEDAFEKNEYDALKQEKAAALDYLSSLVVSPDAASGFHQKFSLENYITESSNNTEQDMVQYLFDCVQDYQLSCYGTTGRIILTANSISALQSRDDIRRFAGYLKESDAELRRLVKLEQEAEQEAEEDDEYDLGQFTEIRSLKHHRRVDVRWKTIMKEMEAVYGQLQLEWNGCEGAKPMVFPVLNKDHSYYVKGFKANRSPDDRPKIPIEHTGVISLRTYLRDIPAEMMLRTLKMSKTDLERPLVAIELYCIGSKLGWKQDIEHHVTEPTEGCALAIEMAVKALKTETEAILEATISDCKLSWMESGERLFNDWGSKNHGNYLAFYKRSGIHQTAGEKENWNEAVQKIMLADLVNAFRLVYEMVKRKESELLENVTGLMKGIVTSLKESPQTLSQGDLQPFYESLETDLRKVTSTALASKDSDLIESMQMAYGLCIAESSKGSHEKRKGHMRGHMIDNWQLLAAEKVYKYFGDVETTFHTRNLYEDKKESQTKLDAKLTRKAIKAAKEALPSLALEIEKMRRMKKGKGETRVVKVENKRFLRREIDTARLALPTLASKIEKCRT
ncbi:hypothetical protein MBLNU13_g11027t2 [Cladosporium sp. NU13]